MTRISDPKEFQGFEITANAKIQESLEESLTCTHVKGGLLD